MSIDLSATKNSSSSSRLAIESALRAERNQVAQMTIALSPLIERVTPLVQQTLLHLDAAQRYADTLASCQKMLHVLNTPGIKNVEKAFSVGNIRDPQVKAGTKAIWDTVLAANPEHKIRQKLLTEIQSGIESKLTATIRIQISQSDNRVGATLQPLLEALKPFAPETSLAEIHGRLENFSRKESPAPNAKTIEATASLMDDVYNRTLALKAHLLELSTLCKRCSDGEHAKGNIAGLVSKKQIKEAASAHVDELITQWDKATIMSRPSGFSENQKLLLSTLSSFESSLALAGGRDAIDKEATLALTRTVFPHFSYDQLGIELESLSDEKTCPYPVERNLAHQFFRMVSAEYVVLEAHTERLRSLGVDDPREYAITCSPKMLARKERAWDRIVKENDWFKDIVSAHPRILAEPYTDFLRYALKVRNLDEGIRNSSWFTPFSPTHNPAAYASHASIDKLVTEVRAIQGNFEKQLQLQEKALYLRLVAELPKSLRYIDNLDETARCLAFGFFETEFPSEEKGNGAPRKKLDDVERAVRHRSDSNMAPLSKDSVLRALELLKRADVLVSRYLSGSKSPYYSVRKDSAETNHWSAPYIETINALNQQYRTLSAARTAARLLATKKRSEEEAHPEVVESPVEKPKNNGLSPATTRLALARSLRDLDAKISGCESTLFDSSQRAAALHRYLATLSVSKLHALHKGEQTFRDIGNQVKRAAEASMQQQSSKKTKKPPTTISTQILGNDRISRQVVEGAIEKATKTHLTPLLTEVTSTVSAIRSASTGAFNLFSEVSQHEKLDENDERMAKILEELVGKSSIAKGGPGSEATTNYLTAVGHCALSLSQVRQAIASYNTPLHNNGATDTNSQTEREVHV